MKRIFVLTLLIFWNSGILAQGMFTEKGKFSLDIGTAYLRSSTLNGLSFNLSSSLFGVVDLGANYFKSFPSSKFKKIEGGTGYIDFYAQKDSSYGVVVNLAVSTSNYQGSFLVGSSLYGRFIHSDGFPFNIFPYLSLGLVSAKNLAIGFGLAFENSLNNKHSLVITPAVNADITSGVAQFILALEFIFK